MAAGDITEGHRFADVPPGGAWNDMAPGGYRRVIESNGTAQWYICDPRGMYGRLGLHTVTEHDDRTITVSPSIDNTGEHRWHGYLERGVWREVG